MATCNRKFDLAGKVFFLQPTFFLARPGSEPGALNRSRKPSTAALWSWWRGSRMGRHDWSLLAAFEPARNGYQRFMRVVAHFVRDRVRRGPPD